MPSVSRLVTAAAADVSVRQTARQAQVPQLKRRLEQLLIMTKGLLQSSGAAQRILVGNLRHKDLAGQVVPSQAYPEASSEEEGEGEEEEDAEPEPAPGMSLLTCPYLSASMPGSLSRVEHVHVNSSCPCGAWSCS